jgi:hypothetical protein
MHKVKRRLVAFCVLLACGGTAAAAGTLRIVGFDDMSCRAWTASKDDAEQRAAFVAWVRGVLTGHNYALRGQQVSVVSAGTVENFVNRYCTQNPQGQFSDAALRMADQFSGRNSPIVK